MSARGFNKCLFLLFIMPFSAPLFEQIWISRTGYIPHAVNDILRNAIQVSIRYRRQLMVLHRLHLSVSGIAFNLLPNGAGVDLPLIRPVGQQENVRINLDQRFFRQNLPALDAGERGAVIDARLAAQIFEMAALAGGRRHG